MEDVHLRAIRANNVALGKGLELDLVMPSLIQSGIYEPFEVATLKSEPGKLARNQSLLAGIETRGQKAYQAFLSALRDARQGHLASAIEAKANSHPTHTGTQKALYGPMQTTDVFLSQPFDPVWPNPKTPAVLDTYHIAPPQVPIKQEMFDSDKVYRMTSKPRGWALIINNKNFKTERERKGTEVDGRNLHNIFKQLGFNVDTKTNLNAQDMAITIEKFAKMNHSTFDCVILAILSHGVEGAILGVDEEELKEKDVYKYFDGAHAPTLSGKPKLIILQACRGKQEDIGIETTDALGAGYVEESQTAPSSPLVTDSEALFMSMPEKELDAPVASTTSKVPMMIDMLIAYATVPGFVAYRNTEQGSWFIQALTEVLFQNAGSEDMLSMLTMVNARVAKTFESYGRNKQMPAPVNMLTKKLYFFPRIPSAMRT